MPTCPCQQFCIDHPGTILKDGHVLGSSEDFPWMTQLQSDMLGASSKDTIYPSMTQYLEKARKEMDKWIMHYDLPKNPTDKGQTFLSQQWNEHIQACKSTDLYNHSTAKELKKLFQHFIIQCEDHQANKLCVYCPKMYLHLHEKTLQDKSTFQVHETTPSMLHESLLNEIPRKIRKTYKWGIKQKAKLPSSYIFPKSKKHYTTARPVITFHKTQLSKLWRAFGKLIYDITRKVFFNTFHNKSTTETFQMLHQFLKQNKNMLKKLMAQ